jgi:hypothetical protein
MSHCGAIKGGRSRHQRGKRREKCALAAITALHKPVIDDPRRQSGRRTLGRGYQRLQSGEPAIFEIDAFGENPNDKVVKGARQIGAFVAHALKIRTG